MKFLLPTACIACQGFQQSTICEKCFNLLKQSQVNRCHVCASSDINHQYCSTCQIKPPHFDSTLCLDHYGGCLTDAMHRYKYQHQVALAHGFIDAWISIYGKEFYESQAIDIILPIPMSYKKLHQRGFNQSWELCKRFSKRLRIKRHGAILMRSHLEENQVLANKTERLMRLSNVFEIDRSFINWIQGKNIALVDDVMTTGATLNTIAQVLKDFGAQSVHNWVILRTPLKKYAECCPS
jgi:ComF family protein